MSIRISKISCVLCCVAALVVSKYVQAIDPATSDDKDSEKIVPVYKTEAEWKKQLTRTQFEVTRHKATEPAHHNKYWNNKRAGSYRCICCDLELFTSDTKFESGTGWPSFWSPAKKSHVRLTEDSSELPARTEVLCARCDAHLGHVFGDGPPPTGLRFCMNSASLNFIESADKSGKQTKKPADKAVKSDKAK